MISGKLSLPARILASKRVLFILKCGNILIAAAALGLLIWSAYYVPHPGPSTYYSHFACLYFASCLIFQAIQSYLLLGGYTRTFNSRFRTFSAYIYWSIITLSGFICFIAYAARSKADCAVIQLLVFLNGLASVYGFQRLRRNISTSISETVSNDELLPATSKFPVVRTSVAGTTANGLSEGSEVVSRKPIKKRRIRRCCASFWRWFNRLFKFAHLAFSVLFICGAITLDLQYRFENPGKRVQIQLPTGETTTLNYNCTVIPNNGTSHPTIWFEGDAAHGVVDFLGMQMALAERHGRNSCSYDPPNFGWSDRMISTYKDFNEYFDPLLDALDMQSEDRILAGWGDGLKNALYHSVAHPDLTKALVIMDTSPNGIEWFDIQRANNWNSQQMMRYRGWDLSGRSFLAEMILSLAIPWGLMSAFAPSNSSAYYSKSAYARYHAQVMKEDFWAAQYYEVLQEASGPISRYLVDTTVGNNTKTYALMTYNASEPETYPGTNKFYRTTKLQMANHIAGGQLDKSVVWCMDDDCSLDFPVRKSTWTADAIISLEI